MTETVQTSEAITRKSASNLALAFILLPKPKRQAMCAFYAFCREIDDVADDDSRAISDRARELQNWREDLRLLFEGKTPRFQVNRELAPIIGQYKLPFDLFDELLVGVETDLSVSRFRSWDELEQYCYRVASVVGLLSIEIFEYSNPRCRNYAVHLGKALQLTNILRDVRNDAKRGRIYLPLEEMERWGVAEQEVLEGKHTDRYERLAGAVAARARAHYAQARELLPPEDRKSMASAELMGSVYWGLLRKLEAKNFNVFSPRKTRLNSVHKAYLIARAWFRMWRGAVAPNYGAS